MFEKVTTSLLNGIPPRMAHHLALLGLRYAGFLLSRSVIEDDPFHYSGLVFPNRLGIAAGFDKNGDCIKSLSKLGFGHLEIGSVTNHPRKSHPDAFITRTHDGLINYLGMPNKGFQHANEQIQDSKVKIPLGLNISAVNKAEELLWMTYKSFSDYVVLNLSCPNLEFPLDRLQTVLNNIRHAVQKPILVKLGPDGNHLTLAIMSLRAGMDGFVATNSTRKHPWGRGGLSGASLELRSNRVIRDLRKLDQNALIIGVGGVMDHESYLRKRDAGADLVQVYAGFVRKGPRLIREILRSS